jgi:hypothetical protein
MQARLACLGEEREAFDRLVARRKMMDDEAERAKAKWQHPPAMVPEGALAALRAAAEAREAFDETHKQPEADKPQATARLEMGCDLEAKAFELNPIFDIGTVEFCQHNGLVFCSASAVLHIVRHRASQQAGDIKLAIRYLELMLAETGGV